MPTQVKKKTNLKGGEWQHLRCRHDMSNQQENNINDVIDALTERLQRVSGLMELYKSKYFSEESTTLSVTNELAIERAKRLELEQKAHKWKEIQNKIDKDMEMYWEMYTHVERDIFTDTILTSFLHFPKGTSGREIRDWFDARYSKGVAYLFDPFCDDES